MAKFLYKVKHLFDEHGNETSEDDRKYVMATEAQVVSAREDGVYHFEIEPNRTIKPTHELIKQNGRFYMTALTVAGGRRRRRSKTSKSSKKRSATRRRSSKRMSRKMNKRRK